MQFKGEQITLKLNWHAFFVFGEAIKADTPSEAEAAIADMIVNAKDVTFKRLQVLAALAYAMIKEGTPNTKITLEDCYDIATEGEIVEGIVKTYIDFIPKPEKKSETPAEVVAE